MYWTSVYICILINDVFGGELLQQKAVYITRRFRMDTDKLDADKMIADNLANPSDLNIIKKLSNSSKKLIIIKPETHNNRARI